MSSLLPTPVDDHAHESELTWLSTRELASRLARREVSSREVLSDQLARIDSVDPVLNAVVARDDGRAHAQAANADAITARCQRSTDASGSGLGRLHGVPLTHKESNDVAGWTTTRGSKLLLGNVASEDALIIARLRTAGIVTSGKTNVPEFTAGSHTFNDLFGTTVNPYDTTKSAAGSSGGAAAAISAGVQASGDGSDMGGSLRTPASFTNIVGMRPSNGRIPHVLPANPWQWLAQTGFMARTVSDLALLMSVACGPAAGAPSAISEPASVFDRREFAEPEHHEPGSGLTGLRIGFSTDLGGLIPVERRVADVLGPVAGVLAAAGACVDEALPDLHAADEVFRIRRAYDFAVDYRELVRDHRDEVREAVVWNTELGLDLSVDDLIEADRARCRLQASVEQYFSHHDLFVLTTSQVAPFDANIEYPHEIDGQQLADYLEWMRAATIVSATGCPAVSVPAGFTSEGLPVGVQFVAAPGKDVELLLACQAFEELTNHHRRTPVL